MSSVKIETILVDIHSDRDGGLEFSIMALLSNDNK